MYLFCIFYKLYIHSNLLVSLQKLFKTCSMISTYLFRCVNYWCVNSWLQYFIHLFWPFVTCLASFMTIMQSNSFTKVLFLFLTIVDTSWRRETDWSVYSFSGAGPHSWYKSHQGHGWVWTKSRYNFRSFDVCLVCFPFRHFFPPWVY